MRGGFINKSFSPTIVGPQLNWKEHLILPLFFRFIATQFCLHPIRGSHVLLGVYFHIQYIHIFMFKGKLGQMYSLLVLK